MGPCEILFGFSGRISRGLFTTATLALITLVVAADWFVIDPARYLLPPGVRPMLFVLVVLFGGAGALTVLAALATKRLHDLGRSGMEMLPSVALPVAGLLLTAAFGGAPLLKYAFLAMLADVIARLAFVAGEAGDNRFGPDPHGAVRVYETA